MDNRMYQLIIVLIVKVKIELEIYQEALMGDH
jgi:hypothetical protein